jgi:hypothetical protein
MIGEPLPLILRVEFWLTNDLNTEGTRSQRPLSEL